MKIYISYYGNLKKIDKSGENIVPISITKTLPEGLRDNKTFYMNRLKILALPDLLYNILEKNKAGCDKNCRFKNLVPNCPFMLTYYKYLNKLDFDKIIKRIEEISDAYFFPFEKKTAVLLVYEGKDCNCAERPILQRWFKEHGRELEEYEA